MRLLVVGCIALVVGIGIGLFEARASSIKYDYFLTGKDVPKMSDNFLNGYASGTYDTLRTVVWFANDDPQSKDDFTAATFTKQYQCLQQIPSSPEIVAWAKAYWAKNPNVVAANEIVSDACLYKPGQARSNVMTGGTGTGRTQGGTNHR
jgi:hypothetical protein